MIAADTPPQPKRESAHPPIVVVDVGNSSTSVGLWCDSAVTKHRSFPTDGLDDLTAELKALIASSDQGGFTDVAIASVAPAALDPLRTWIRHELNLEPLVVGEQIALPIDVAVKEPESVGVDRVCCAAAAFERNKQACVVVDFGTAITVDAVDDNGVFMGGAIFPGVHLQARSLHEHTAALPEVTREKPDEIIGRDTTNAIRSGILYGTAGAVRGVVEAIATCIGRWPPAIATGGDAAWVAESCNIFDAIVPELCLQGVGLAYSRRLERAVTL